MRMYRPSGVRPKSNFWEVGLFVDTVILLIKNDMYYCNFEKN